MKTITDQILSLLGYQKMNNFLTDKIQSRMSETPKNHEKELQDKFFAHLISIGFKFSEFQNSSPSASKTLKAQSIYGSFFMFTIAGGCYGYGENLSLTMRFKTFKEFTDYFYNCNFFLMVKRFVEQDMLIKSLKTEFDKLKLEFSLIPGKGELYLDAKDDFNGNKSLLK